MRTRSAICFSRSESSMVRRKSAVSLMGMWQTSAMLRPPRVTAIDTGLRRLPWHSGQGTSRMKPSKRSRLVSDSASRCRRSM